MSAPAPFNPWQYILSDGVMASLPVAPGAVGGYDDADPAFVHATIPFQETISHNYLIGEKPIVDQINRLTQWIGICCTIKAQNCAGQRLRLYRVARSAKLRGRTFRRVTDRKRLEYLRGEGPFAARAWSKAMEYAAEADGIEEVTESPAIDLLRRPNPITSGYAYALARFMDLESCGNCFSHVQYTNGEPSQLYRLAPHKTAVLPDKERFIRGYRYGWLQQDKVIFPPEQVDQFHYMPSPFTPFLGMTWVQWVILDADRFNASSVQDLSMWMNGSRPDSMMKVPANAGDAQIKAMQAEIDRRFRGPSKSHKVFVTTAEEITPIQWSPKDLEGVASRRDAMQLILAAAGVPEPFVMMTDSNRASAASADDLFARRSIAPRLCQDQDELTHKYLPRFGLLPGDHWFAYDNPVPDDVKAQTERHVSYAAAGIKTWNEVRAEMGDEPFAPEIGDVPRVNGIAVATLDGGTEGADGETNGQDGGTQGAGADPAAAASGPGAEGADVQATALNGAQTASLQSIVTDVATGVLPGESARAMIRASFPTVPEQLIEQMVGPAEKHEPPEPEPNAQDQLPGGGDAGGVRPGAAGGGDAGAAGAGDRGDGGGKGAGPAARKSWHPAFGPDRHAKDDRNPPKETPAQREATQQIEAACRRWYDSIHADLKKGQQIAEAMDGRQAQLADALRPVLMDALRAAAVNALADAGDTQINVPDAARHYLDNYTPRLAREITDNTQQMLRTALREGLDAGESTADIQQRIAAALNQEADYRAERIARTETANMTGRGRLTGSQVAGMTHKHWLPDPRACEMCLALAAKGDIPIDEPYARIGEVIGGKSVDWQDIQCEPAHPNCFCESLSVMKDEGDEGGDGQ